MKMLRKSAPVSRFTSTMKQLLLHKLMISFVFVSFLIAIHLKGVSFNNYMEIYFLNIGQGDAILVKTEDNRYMLVDTGPDNTILQEIGKYMPFWIKKIDYLIVTHPDSDHLGGVLSLLNSYKVDVIYSTNVENNTDLFEQYKDLLIEKGIESLKLSEGDILKIGCCAFVSVLWPSKIVLENNDTSTNNTSLSFYLEYGEFDAFLGGDLDSKFEEILSISNPKDIDLLKVGHHGSKNSTTEKFLKRLSPEYAVISVGKENTYGHPHEETIQKLKEENISYFLTYDYSKLFFRTDGQTLYCYAR